MPTRILVIEDSTTVRQLIAGVLEHHGYLVDQAADGIAALEGFAAATPNVVITDLGMPRLDGYGFLQRFRTVLLEVPVIVLAAHSDIARALRASRTEEVFDYLLKPIAAEILLMAVQCATEVRRLHAQANAIEQFRAAHTHLHATAEPTQRPTGALFLPVHLLRTAPAPANITRSISLIEESRAALIAIVEAALPGGYEATPAPPHYP